MMRSTRSRNPRPNSNASRIRVNVNPPPPPPRLPTPPSTPIPPASGSSLMQAGLRRAIRQAKDQEISRREIAPLGRSRRSAVPGAVAGGSGAVPGVRGDASGARGDVGGDVGGNVGGALGGARYVPGAVAGGSGVVGGARGDVGGAEGGARGNVRGGADGVRGASGEVNGARGDVGGVVGGARGGVNGVRSGVDRVRGTSGGSLDGGERNDEDDSMKMDVDWEFGDAEYMEVDCSSFSFFFFTTKKQQKGRAGSLFFCSSIYPIYFKVLLIPLRGRGNSLTILPFVIGVVNGFQTIETRSGVTGYLAIRHLRSGPDVRLLTTSVYLFDIKTPWSKSLDPSTPAVVWTALPGSPFLHQVHSLRCHPTVCAGCAEAFVFDALWFWRVARRRRHRGCPTWYSTASFGVVVLPLLAFRLGENPFIRMYVHRALTQMNLETLYSSGDSFGPTQRELEGHGINYMFLVLKQSHSK
ncbi:hypothetical protein BDC45DRAFT_529400 [Circinella umbellata]|nr:hypothetical protein BDC45DRAFT_529400 [Circinella umbellata]